MSLIIKVTDMGHIGNICFSSIGRVMGLVGLPLPASTLDDLISASCAQKVTNYTHRMCK